MLLMLKTALLVVTLVGLSWSGVAQTAFPALLANGPAAQYRDKLMLFGQFIGNWEFQGWEYPINGERISDKGRIEFAWVLGGRAVQDVWIEDERSDRKVKTYGTTIRFYDPTTDVWQITWIDPPAGHVQLLTGRKEGDEIVLEGKRSDGVAIKWVFSDIKADSFHWSGHEFVDGRWRLAEECSPHRVGTIPR